MQTCVYTTYLVTPEKLLENICCDISGWGVATSMTCNIKPIQFCTLCDSVGLSEDCRFTVYCELHPLLFSPLTHVLTSPFPSHSIQCNLRLINTDSLSLYYGGHHCQAF